MSHKLQPVRGTHDILPEEFEKFHAVVTRARELATLYGFKEMVTPIFEMTEVFSRSMGETSDVVSKEMFTFQTKGEESVTLRPEFTAGMARAFISNGMQQHLPLKLFSTGPLFRYERPQKGRQRQFHQVNFEWLGDDSPEADVEIIMLAGNLLHEISGSGKSCTLLINTLGDQESRVSYRTALVDYLSPYSKELSEDSQRRLGSNPLRILDSKSEQDRKILENAPQITQHLSQSAGKRFDAVCMGLSKLPLLQNYKINPSLVRGLDYYTDTVFEFVAETGDLGAQNTVLAGGRYDGLIEQMGGKPTPAIGFAAGIERLILLAQDSAGIKSTAGKEIKIFLLPLEDQSPADIHYLADILRSQIFSKVSRTYQKCSVEILWNGKLGKRMEKASKQGASHCIILGEEMQREVFILKNMATGDQNEVSFKIFKDAEKLMELFRA